MRYRLFCVLAVAFGTLAFAAVASAEPKVDSSQRLRMQVDAQAGCAETDSTAGWVTGQDSPSDSNHHLFDANIGSTAVGCVVLYSNASVNRHVAVGNQKNISIQLRTTSVVLGENYMVAEVSTDGNNTDAEDTLFLDPADCNHPVGSSTTWVRADFTGFKGDTTCKIVVNADTAEYTSDATHSAFQNYAIANPGAVVIEKFVVIANPGDNRFDRIALGAGKMYDNDSSHAVNCTTEASCS